MDLTQNFEEKFTPDYEEEDLVFEEHCGGGVWGGFYEYSEGGEVF